MINTTIARKVKKEKLLNKLIFMEKPTHWVNTTIIRTVNDEKHLFKNPWRENDLNSLVSFRIIVQILNTSSRNKILAQGTIDTKSHAWADSHTNVGVESKVSNLQKSAKETYVLSFFPT